MSLAIISFDAVSSADTAFLCGLEHFSSLARRGTLVTEVSSVFITNTYPAHSSVITGMLPCRHGVVENTFPNAGRLRPDWRCGRDNIKTTTLYDEARKAGIKTCSILWPVSANANIWKNMPEAVAREGENQALALLRAGSKRFQLWSFLKYGRHLRGISQPGLDNFTTRCAVSAARRGGFDLLLLHLTDVDSHKHKFGPDSLEAKDALRRLDSRLGELMRAYEGWDFIVFGDHGCKSVSGSVNLNDFWCEPQSFWHLAGGCAFLSHSVGQSARQGVEKLVQNPECHIKRVLSESEMAQSGLDREFALGVEAEDGWCFAVSEYKGNHGYSLLDDESYSVFYLAAGRNIPQNKKASGGSIMDIAPLGASLLGLPLWDMDGRLNTEVYNV